MQAKSSSKEVRPQRQRRFPPILLLVSVLREQPAEGQAVLPAHSGRQLVAYRKASGQVAVRMRTVPTWARTSAAAQ